MSLWTDVILILVVLANLKVLGSSRLLACIRVVAFQGIVLGVLPLLSEAMDMRILLASTASTILKGLVFPALLVRALRESPSRREVDPSVGYTTSLLAGVGMIVLSLWLASRLGLVITQQAPMVVPCAFFTVMVGLFLIVSRRNAITQVLGYLVMENGIYTFGMNMAHQQPLLVELGILLDVFMAVFVMGITIYHINRAFDHIETDRMSALKD